MKLSGLECEVATEQVIEFAECDMCEESDWCFIVSVDHRGHEANEDEIGSFITFCLACLARIHAQMRKEEWDWTHPCAHAE